MFWILFAVLPITVGFAYSLYWQQKKQWRQVEALSDLYSKSLERVVENPQDQSAIKFCYLAGKDYYLYVENRTYVRFMDQPWVDPEIKNNLDEEINRKIEEDLKQLFSLYANNHSTKEQRKKAS